MSLNIIILILGIVLIVGAIGSFIISEAEVVERKEGLLRLMVAIGISLILFSQCFVIIGTGYTGVRVTFGQIAKREVPQGFTFKAPFVQSIYKVNLKQQDLKVTEKDQYVESTITGKIPITITNIYLTYKINGSKAAYIYRNISNPDDLLTVNIVTSAIKATTPSFDTDTVVVRSSVEEATKKNLQKYVDEKYGKDIVEVIQITLGNISFTDEYNTSVNEKNVAKQEAEKQEIENTKNVEKAKAEAEALLTKAEAEKKANELMEKSLTDAILMQQYLDTWDGKLPQVTGSDNVMLDIGQLQKTDSLEE